MKYIRNVAKAARNHVTRTVMRIVAQTIAARRVVSARRDSSGFVESVCPIGSAKPTAIPMRSTRHVAESVTRCAPINRITARTNASEAVSARRVTFA